MSSAPRIYNLFPLLVGDTDQWRRHLPRIAAMGFDWVFINPFHYPGFSGSLYAIKDHYRLHPLFQGNSSRPYTELLGSFLQDAHAHGLRVMMDLVINHTAKDALMVGQHPTWYAREADGNLRSPFAAAPDDPDNVEKRTVWGDLAEIDYANPENRHGLARYWSQLVDHYGELGFDGFRCDAAYKIPGDVWALIIDSERKQRPGTVFFAETLGCQPAEAAQLVSAGFDYLFNSSKWWDFRAPWLLEQYDLFRPIAPTISFPESHDTARLADESGGDERISRLRYLFAAAFSSGLMTTVGYEYGFRRPLHVVDTRPEHWEQPGFDISHFIAAVNRMKATTPLLNEEGPQQIVTQANDPVIALLRASDRQTGKVLTLINPSADAGHCFGTWEAADLVGCEPHHLVELMSGPAHTSWIDLPPLSIRLFAEKRR